MSGHTCRLPIVYSNQDYLSELLVERGVITPEEIAKAMHALATNTSYRKERISSGLKRIEAFSWEETATQSLALYEETLSTPPSKC